MQNKFLSIASKDSKMKIDISTENKYLLAIGGALLITGITAYLLFGKNKTPDAKDVEKDLDEAANKTSDITDKDISDIEDKELDFDVSGKFITVDILDNIDKIVKNNIELNKSVSIPAEKTLYIYSALAKKITNNKILLNDSILGELSTYIEEVNHLEDKVLNFSNNILAADLDISNNSLNTVKLNISKEFKFENLAGTNLKFGTIENVNYEYITGKSYKFKRTRETAEFLVKNVKKLEDVYKILEEFNKIINDRVSFKLDNISKAIAKLNLASLKDADINNQITIEGYTGQEGATKFFKDLDKVSKYNAKLINILYSTNAKTNKLLNAIIEYGKSLVSITAKISK